MTTTKIWVEKKLVLDETVDLDVDADRIAASTKTLDTINRASRAKQEWRIEIFEPHAPASHRTWFQTSGGDEGWIPAEDLSPSELDERLGGGVPHDEGGYLSTFFRFAFLVIATAFLLLPFFVFDLVVILLVLATIGLVRSYRLRRAQKAWRERRLV